MVFLCNRNHHTNESLSCPNGHVVGGELDQEITTGNQLVEDNSINIDNCCNTSLFTIDALAVSADSLTAKKTIQNRVNLDIPIVNSDIDSSLVTSSNSDSNLDLKDNILESVTDDETSKADDTLNGNLNHQTCISQNEFPENDIAVVPIKFSVKNRVTQSVSSTSIGVINVLYYRILAIVTMCCISGFLLLPIILYYAMQTGNNIGIDTEYSHGNNVIVCYKLRLDNTHINTHS